MPPPQEELRLDLLAAEDASSASAAARDAAQEAADVKLLADGKRKAAGAAARAKKAADVAQKVAYVRREIVAVMLAHAAELGEGNGEGGDFAADDDDCDDDDESSDDDDDDATDAASLDVDAARAEAPLHGATDVATAGEDVDDVDDDDDEEEEEEEEEAPEEDDVEPPDPADEPRLRCVAKIALHGEGIDGAPAPVRLPDAAAVAGNGARTIAFFLQTTNQSNFCCVSTGLATGNDGKAFNIISSDTGGKHLGMQVTIRRCSGSRARVQHLTRTLGGGSRRVLSGEAHNQRH